MMAPDSRYLPEPRPLSDETLAVLRAAVLGHLQHSPGMDSGLERAVAAVVREARQRAMRPEELIVAFKSLYSSLPEPPTTAARAEQARLRERLVTACIRAYYGGDLGSELP
jgi:hypothetical protein